MSAKSVYILSLLVLICSCMKNGKNSLTNDVADVVDTLWYPLDSIPVDSEYVHICASEDGNMKFYSWNSGLGGTCPDYAVLCLFHTKDGNSAIEDLRIKEGEPALVSKVHSIKKNDGSTYYITTRSHKASSNDGYMWMDAFVIDKDTLRHVSVFDGGDVLDEYEMEINYVISDWYYATNGEGWNWLFEYDAGTRNLYVPITVYAEDEFPVISDRYRLYHFDGKRFIDKGEAPHKGLHISLNNYYRLARYFVTKNYIVRVDKLKDGNYRYASWKSPSNMSEKPRLIITGGKYDEENDDYTFVNEGIEYKVGYSEDESIGDGVFEHHEFLWVQKNGKTLLKEERISK